MLPNNALQSRQGLLRTFFLELLEGSGVGAGTTRAGEHHASHIVLARRILEKKRTQGVVVRLHQARVTNEPMLPVDSLQISQNTHESPSPCPSLIIFGSGGIFQAAGQQLLIPV
jgi:hypothetical protein